MTIRQLLFTLCFTGILSLVATPGLAAEAEGTASYYADSLQGNKTASGETYDKNAMTAGHHTLPFGTKVKVTYLKTGKSVEVSVNDRIPNKKKTIIEVSGAAAAELGLKEDGMGKVKIEYSE